MLILKRIHPSIAVLLTFLLGLTVLIYYQALDSQFLLDDYVNLSNLKLVEKYGYSNFVFSGLTGSAGRPLALLTFAFQHQAWPDDPIAFKTVNLIFHLLNGLLVFLLARVLIKRLSLYPPRTTIYSFFIAGLWLLHPIQYTTVLYVIQRMNLMSGFFILLGAIGYLYFREKYEQRAIKTGLIGMSFSVAFGIVFGVLSKENAILLPIFILLIEAFIHPSIFKDLKWRMWGWLFLALPLILLGCYLAYRLGYDLKGYESRPFSMKERLLTQGVVLFDYIEKILIPRLGEYGLHYDDIKASKGILSPPITAVAWFTISALIIISFLIRKRIPLVAFGILWFFAGHLLESSHVSLELYFEHRNYLPLFGLCCAIAGLVDYLSGYIRNSILIPFVAGYLTLILLISFIEADTWSKPVLQSEEWVKQHPQSTRAIQRLANTYLLYKQYDDAKKTYDELSSVHPESIYPDLQLLIIKSCVEGNNYTNRQWQELYEKAGTSVPEGPAFLVSIHTLVIHKRMDACADIGIIDLIRLILILAHNQNFDKHKAILHEFASILAVKYGDPRSAIANINKAIDERPHPNRYILKIKILIQLNQIEEAEKVLGDFKNYLKKRPARYIAYIGQIRELEKEMNQVNQKN